jgi:4-hydroxy-tetrahydrodipicolinate synthase
MNRNSVNWSGPMPAVVTPFRDDGAIDEGAFQANLELMVEKGATGFVVGGCTGEFWAMSKEERTRIVELAARTVAGKATIIAGAGAIQKAEVIELIKAAQDVGADGALVLPPYFVQLSDDEIFANFEAISDAVTLPIVLYNIPQVATNTITPELALRLSALDQVVAIKESAGNWNNFHKTAMAVRHELRVFCGPSSVYGAASIGAGADGFIDCFPNVWAPGGLDLYYTAVRGDLDEANALQELGIRLTTLFTSEGRSLYPATKAAMELMGLPGGKPRPPLKTLTRDQYEGLRTGLIELGLLEGSSRAGIRATA